MADNVEFKTVIASQLGCVVYKGFDGRYKGEWQSVSCDLSLHDRFSMSTLVYSFFFSFYFFFCLVFGDVWFYV
jgi:hypothetical protein